ncbi:class II glutamine amidotransferase [Streptomyces sp. NPDC008092]|uniref:class II glutamine amidotransferase n=1 Tax=Streptomyces sp. NPDC008092 TaxID=3364808 RepID=UPI0036E0E853
MAAWFTDRATTPVTALGREVVDRIAHLSTVHADGWGAAWVDPAGAHHTHRSVLPAHTDPGFADFMTGTETRACFVHVRLGTPGYGTGLANVHPFVRDGWAFAHNGAILPAGHIDALLPPGSERKPEGQTDSEIYFLALLEEMDHTAGDLVTAADRVIARTTDAGLHASSLNAILLGPDILAVISHHDPTAGTGHVRVWPDDERATGVTWPPYHPMLHTRRPGFEAVVSSGLVPEPAADGWNSLADDLVWSVALESGHSTLRPLAGYQERITPVPVSRCES